MQAALFDDLPRRKVTGVDGFRLADAIKKIAPAAPIVIISAYFYPHDPKVRQLLDRGVARRFIGKPFRHDEIIAAARESVVNDPQWRGLHSPLSTSYGIPSRAAARRRRGGAH